MSRQLVAYPCVKPPWSGHVRKRLKLRYLGVDRAKSALGAASRQVFNIVAYTGSNGGGKTACAVYDMLPTLAGERWACRNIGHLHSHDEGCTFRPDTLAGCSCVLRPAITSVGTWDPPAEDDEYDDWYAAQGFELSMRLSDWQGEIPGRTEGWRTAWSTTPLLEQVDGVTRLHRRYRPLRSLRDLVRCEHGRVLLDEVQGVADARDHQSMPAGFRKMVYELRRRDVPLGWTAVDYSAADARMRQITQAVVYARGMDAEASSGGLWQPKRLFRWSTFDASEFEVLTAGKRAELKPIGTQFVWRPGHLLERSYDTLAPVLSLSMASDSGVCMSCGGAKRRDPCGCPVDEADLPPGIAVQVDERGRRRRVPVPLTGADGDDRLAVPDPAGGRPQRSEDVAAAQHADPAGPQLRPAAAWSHGAVAYPARKSTL